MSEYIIKETTHVDIGLDSRRIERDFEPGTYDDAGDEDAAAVLEHLAAQGLAELVADPAPEPTAEPAKKPAAKASKAKES